MRQRWADCLSARVLSSQVPLDDSLIGHDANAEAGGSSAGPALAGHGATTRRHRSTPFSFEHILGFTELRLSATSMRWAVHAARCPPRFRPARHRHLKRTLSSVSQLDAGDLDSFKQTAFDVGKPVKLTVSREDLPPACTKWFVNDTNGKGAKLRGSFWPDFKDILIPLEVTSKSPNSNAEDTSLHSSFHRAEAPLSILLAYLRQPSSSLGEHDHSVYLAQCSLQSLPKALQDDLPIPEIVLKAGRGDIYDSSLWMGLPPTYTPLHRDPNPNFFLQLVGRKIVRLLPPVIGNTVFDMIQDDLQRRGAASPSSAAFRGEEMMAGPEANLLHDAVWLTEAVTGALVQEYGQEAEIGEHEALFIPKGWWHSVKGIGKGVTASVNWWFR